MSLTSAKRPFVCECRSGDAAPPTPQPSPQSAKVDDHVAGGPARNHAGEDEGNVVRGARLRRAFEKVTSGGRRIGASVYGPRDLFIDQDPVESVRAQEEVVEVDHL